MIVEVPFSFRVHGLTKAGKHEHQATEIGWAAIHVESHKGEDAPVVGGCSLFAGLHPDRTVNEGTTDYRMVSGQLMRKLTVDIDSMPWLHNPGAAQHPESAELLAAVGRAGGILDVTPDNLRVGMAAFRLGLERGHVNSLGPTLSRHPYQSLGAMPQDKSPVVRNRRSDRVTRSGLCAGSLAVVDGTVYVRSQGPGWKYGHRGTVSVPELAWTERQSHVRADASPEAAVLHTGGATVSGTAWLQPGAAEGHPAYRVARELVGVLTMMELRHCKVGSKVFLAIADACDLASDQDVYLDPAELCAILRAAIPDGTNPATKHVSDKVGQLEDIQAAILAHPVAMPDARARGMR